MKTCKACGKDLIGRERQLCKHCTEAGKDGVQTAATAAGVVVTAVLVLKKYAPKVAPVLREVIKIIPKIK